MPVQSTHSKTISFRIQPALPLSVMFRLSFDTHCLGNLRVNNKCKKLFKNDNITNLTAEDDFLVKVFAFRVHLYFTAYWSFDVFVTFREMLPMRHQITVIEQIFSVVRKCLYGLQAWQRLFSVFTAKAWYRIIILDPSIYIVVVIVNCKGSLKFASPESKTRKE